MSPIFINLNEIELRVLFVTRRIILITVNDILGSCSIDWQVPLSHLRGVPRTNENGLGLILERASKGNLFNSPTNLKQIECSPDNASVCLPP